MSIMIIIWPVFPIIGNKLSNIIRSSGLAAIKPVLWGLTSNLISSLAACPIFFTRDLIFFCASMSIHIAFRNVI